VSIPIERKVAGVALKFRIPLKQTYRGLGKLHNARKISQTPAVATSYEWRYLRNAPEAILYIASRQSPSAFENIAVDL
jgi:hypothetical protein